MKKMKSRYKCLVGAWVVASLAATSCVDDMKFGNAFLEKVSGSTSTIDTVFNSAIYTRQFLNSIYGRQYYGLPYSNNSSELPASSSPYCGKMDALTDCWQQNWSDCALVSQYYSGYHTSNYSRNQDIFGYSDEKVWEAVRWCWLLLENLDRTPGLDADEKARMTAEAKCLIATRYFDLFRHYGGLPILEHSFAGNESSYECPRATVEETVNFMIRMLDEAIDSGALPWAYDGINANSSETGRWTLAGAMALKCKIWQFAASPLFNDNQGYAGGSSEAEQQHLVWYGGYRAELWNNCLTACQEFFNELGSRGYYKLRQSVNDTPAGYRYAYRMGYISQGSTEVLHSVRVQMGDASNSSTYLWHSWSGSPSARYDRSTVQRNNYNPTQEYVEMFPWADGTPFNYNETAAEGRLDEMFMTGTQAEGVNLTRDPRLYESVRVNGLQETLDWANEDGYMSGGPLELWVGGYDALNNSADETGCYATGYGNMKYYLGDEYMRQYCQWVTLRLSDLYLTYAEALLQAQNDCSGALNWINQVRARVGLGGLAECNPGKNLTSDKDALLEELLRERACELGMEDARYYDLIRYKRADIFEKELHGLRIYRLNDAGERVQTKWFEGDQNSGAPQPTHFDYEKFVLNNVRRTWWDYGFDSKWYLSPFPQTEVNKGYGLVQNPGW